jgi:hypothetical protein
MEGTAGCDSGRCPLCRFPVGALDASPERLSPAALDAIRADFPAWTIERGLCTQCLDLYEALAPTASERPARFASIDENHVFE